MKPSNELFNLVKSLSKSEKRFFKLSSSLQSGDKNYLKIFDAIDKQDAYDEAAIKNQFGNETFVQHFPSEKNHLYKLILKSLRNYHSDNSISSVLKQEIKNVEVLYNKALYKECNKFLIRAKKMAQVHEKFYFIFELISWEKLLLEVQFEDGKFTKDLDTIIKEEQDVIAKLRNLAEYHVLYSKINYAFRSGGYTRTDNDKSIVEEISSHPLIVGKNTALSKRAASICYYTQGFCQLANWDYEHAFEKFKKVKTILDDQPKIRKDLAKRYLHTLSKMLSCLIYMGNITEAEKMIAEMEKLGTLAGFKKMAIKVDLFKEISINKLRICMKTGNFSKGLETIDLILEEMPQYEDKLQKEQELIFYYHIAYVYFGSGEYNRSLYWVNKVLNDNENVLRQDIYSYTRLFNLIIHYELGNYDLLEYTTKSTQRYLNKRQRAYDLELIVISFVKKLIKIHNPIDKKEVFTKFKVELDAILKDPENQIVLKYFDFQKWIEAKLSNSSFSEVVKNLQSING